MGTYSISHLYIDFITAYSAIIKDYDSYFLYGTTALSEPGPPHSQGFTITLRHTTVGRTPLDEGSARSRELYLTTHNTHKTHFYNPGRIRTAIRESGRPHTYVLDGAATGIDMVVNTSNSFTLSEFRSLKTIELFLGPTHNCTLNQTSGASSQILLASIRR